MTVDIEWGYEARPQKAAVRTAMLKVGPKKAAIFLPGNEACCVREALSLGTIDENTVIYAAERDPETMALIRAQLSPLFKTIFFHEGDVADLRPTHKIDYALIDLMGSVDRNLAEWLRGLIINKCTTSDFELGLVVAMNWRNASFVEEIAEKAKADEEMWELLEEKCATCSKYILGYSAMLHSLFRGFKPKWKWIFRYQDSRMTMLAFRLHSFVPSETPFWPDWIGGAKARAKPSIKKDVIMKKSTVSKRVGAGAKAWATRRANEAARATVQDKRLSAAHKAWATRRSV